MLDLDRFSPGMGSGGGGSSTVADGGVSSVGGGSTTAVGGGPPIDGTWLIAVDGTATEVDITDAAVDDDGNVYVTGTYAGGTLTLPPDADGEPLDLPQDPELQGFLVSLTPSGDTRWARAMVLAAGPNPKRVPRPRIAWASGPDDGGSLFMGSTYNANVQLVGFEVIFSFGGDAMLVRWRAEDGGVAATKGFAAMGQQWLIDLDVEDDITGAKVFALTGYRNNDLQEVGAAVAQPDALTTTRHDDVLQIEQKRRIEPDYDPMAMMGPDRLDGARIAHGGGRLAVVGTYEGPYLVLDSGELSFETAGGGDDVFVLSLIPETLALSAFTHFGNAFDAEALMVAVDATRTVVGATLDGNVDLGAGSIPFSGDRVEVALAEGVANGFDFLGHRKWGSGRDAGFLAVGDDEAWVVAGTVNGFVPPLNATAGASDGVLGWWSQNGEPGGAMAGTPDFATLLGDGAEQALSAMDARNGVVVIAGTFSGSIGQLEGEAGTIDAPPMTTRMFIGRLNRSDF